MGNPYMVGSLEYKVWEKISTCKLLPHSSNKEVQEFVDRLSEIEFNTDYSADR